MSTQQVPVLPWMNNLLIQKFTLHRSSNVFALQKYSFVKVMNLLIRVNKTKSSLWCKQYWKNWYKWAKHSHTRHTRRHNFIKSELMLVLTPIFRKTPPFLSEKSPPPPFSWHNQFAIIVCPKIDVSDKFISPNVYVSVHALNVLESV